MKKILLLIILLTTFTKINYSQTFIPHESSILEYTNPSVATSSIFHILHTSAHANNDFSMGKIYAYSWSGDGTNTMGTGYDAGIVVRLHNNSEILLNEGFLGLNRVIDLEVGILIQESEEEIYIMATYYELGNGHRMKIYKWDIYTGDFSPFGSTIELSSSPIYSRISQDIHRHYAGAVTWQEGTNVYVKTINLLSGSLVIGNTIIVRNATNGYYPDIALSIPTGSELLIRITYIDQLTGDIIICKERFNYVFSLPTFSSIPFNIDHTQPGVFSTLSHWNDYTIMSSSLNIDCPNNGTSFDNWAVVFSNPYLDNHVQAISKYSVSAPPVLMDISETIGGQWPCLSYDNSGNNIHFGFFSVYYLYPTTYPNIAGFVTTTRQINGFNITGVNTFKHIISPPIGSLSKPVMTFNKNNDFNKLFVVYPSESSETGVIGEMKFKLLPYPWYSSFSDNKYTNNSKFQHFKIYPNPFNGKLNLVLSDEYLTQNLNIILTDMSGKILINLFGKGKELISKFENITQYNIVDGNYILKINDERNNNIINEKISKITD